MPTDQRGLHLNLSRMDETQLLDICMRLGLDKPSDGMSHAKLVRLVEDAIRSSPVDVRVCCGLQALQAMQALLRERPDGSIPRRELPGCPGLGPAMAALHRLGLCRRGVREYTLAPEAAALLDYSEEEGQLLSAVDVLCESYLGYLQLYGMLDAEELSGLEQRSGAPVTHPGLISSLWVRRHGIHGLYRRDGSPLYLIHPKLKNPEILLRLRNSRQTAGLSLASYDLADAQSALICGLPVSGHAMETLEQIARAAHTPPAQAAAISQRAVLRLQAEDAQAALRELDPLSRRLPLSVRSYLPGKLVDQMPQWAFKGHSSAELRRLHAVPGRRIQ